MKEKRSVRGLVGAAGSARFPWAIEEVRRLGYPPEPMVFPPTTLKKKNQKIKKNSFLGGNQ